MNYKVFLSVVALMGVSVHGAGTAPTTQAPANSGGIFGFFGKKEAPAPVVNGAPATSPVVVNQNVAPSVAGSDAACKMAVEKMAAGKGNVDFNVVLNALKGAFGSNVPAECKYVRGTHLPFFSKDAGAADKSAPVNLNYWILDVAKKLSGDAIKAETMKLSGLKKANKAAYDLAKKAHKEASKSALPKPMPGAVEQKTQVMNQITTTVPVVNPSVNGGVMAPAPVVVKPVVNAPVSAGNGMVVNPPKPVVSAPVNGGVMAPAGNSAAKPVNNGAFN